jgi:hypothetical protein
MHLSSQQWAFSVSFMSQSVAWMLAHITWAAAAITLLRTSGNFSVLFCFLYALDPTNRSKRGMFLEACCSVRLIRVSQCAVQSVSISHKKDTKEDKTSVGERSMGIQCFNARDTGRLGAYQGYYRRRRNGLRRALDRSFGITIIHRRCRHVGQICNSERETIVMIYVEQKPLGRDIS